MIATATFAGAAGVIVSEEVPAYVLAMEYWKDANGGVANAVNVLVNVWLTMYTT